MKAASVFLIVSAVSLAGGSYFPLATLADPGPSALAYGILLVSFPAWALGAISGGVAGYLARRSDRPFGMLQGASWALCGTNAAAIVACWIWQPAGIS